MISTQTALARRGMLNVDAQDFTDMIGVNRDKLGTFCNARCAIGSMSRMGKLVYVGDRRWRKCPVCGSENIVHDMVPRRIANKIKEGMQK